MEKTLVEQIAVNQWKLARLDQSEARFYEPGAMTPVEFALAIHRIHLTEARLERSVSSAIADMERYRKERLERQKPLGLDQSAAFRQGLVWAHDGRRYYEVLPKVRGLDGQRGARSQRAVSPLLGTPFFGHLEFTAAVRYLVTSIGTG